MKKRKSTDWCLFLDRDGVINKKLPDDYIKHWDEFKFLPHVLEALKKLNPLFKYIFIVTNQQGIGKGMMTTHELDLIHKQLRKIVRKKGGRIDQIFYCPDLASIYSSCRKPNPGMGLQAKALYPSLDFKKSIMVGDSISDIEFGHSLGMITVLLDPEHVKEKGKADHYCKNMNEFYLTFVSTIK